MFRTLAPVKTWPDEVYKADDIDWSLSPRVLGQLAMILEKFDLETLSKMDKATARVFFSEIRGLAKLAFEDAQRYHAITKSLIYKAETEIIEANLSFQDFFPQDGLMLQEMLSAADGQAGGRRGGVSCFALKDGKKYEGKFMIGSPNAGGRIVFDDARISGFEVWPVEDQDILNVMAPISLDRVGYIWRFNFDNILPQAAILSHDFSELDNPLLPLRMNSGITKFLVAGYQRSANFNLGGVSYDCEIVSDKNKGSK